MSTSFWTNRGARRVFEGVFQGATLPTNFYIALVKASNVPTRDTVTFSQLAEIAAGNGYVAGGIQLGRDATDFDTLTENTTDDEVDVLLRDIVWTASAGPIPSSGDGARYAILTDDNATQANREVWFVWDLKGTRTVSDGQLITLRDLTMKGTVAAAV